MNTNFKLPIDKSLSIIESFEYALDLSRNNFKFIFNNTLRQSALYLISSILLQYCISYIVSLMISSAPTFTKSNIPLTSMSKIFFLLIAIFCLSITSSLALWYWFLKQLAITKFICGFNSSYEEAQKTVNDCQWQLFGFNCIAVIVFVISLGINIFANIYIINFVNKLVIFPLYAILIFFLVLIFIANLLILSNVIISGNIIFCFESSTWSKVSSILMRYSIKYWWKMILAHVVYFTCLIPITIAMVSPLSIIGTIAKLFFSNGIKQIQNEPDFFISIIHGVIQTLIHFYSISIIVFLYGILYLSFKIKYCGLDLINKIENLYETN